MNAPIPDWAEAAASSILANTARTRQGMAQSIANAHQRATQILTCVYCGHAYPPGTPAHGSKGLTDHIRVCEKHPLRAAEEKAAKLRRALVGFVGVDTKAELDAMEAMIRLMPAPDSDKAGMINAIDALKDTL